MLTFWPPQSKRELLMVITHMKVVEGLYESLIASWWFVWHSPVLLLFLQRFQMDNNCWSVLISEFLVQGTGSVLRDLARWGFFRSGCYTSSGDIRRPWAV